VKRVIHWFRRDLRMHDNTALLAALQAAPEVIPVYIVSEWRGNHQWTGAPRQQFLCDSLEALARNLEKIGGRLIVRQGAAEAELARLTAETGADGLFYNRGPDPFGREVEARLERSLGIETRAFKDIAIHERDEVLTGKGEPFRVFTPYARAWRKLPKAEPHPVPRRMRTPADVSSLPLPTLKTWGLRLDADILKGGEDAARQRLEEFLSGPILLYGETRDFPATAGTSRLSQDLRHGLLSSREVYSRAQAVRERANPNQQHSIDTYVNELIWREFYFQVLWYWPEVLEADFNPEYRNVPWYEPGADFDAWKHGETGFPIVNAGMRQLAATGFMHNRLRMITAMFLTKDLHIHWKTGEGHFMRHLVDGEIASNNGGWQWSAGTGADAAPYFHIQNPWTQSARFDPKGEFIKHWVPELRGVHPALFSTPPEPGRRICAGYPRPIVDHATEREAALLMFRQR
jgi:deoxyribodipyrimidine photo-lyase